MKTLTLKQKQDNAQREQKLENDQKTKMENEQRKIEEIQMCEKPQNNKKEPNDDTEPTILPEIDNQAAPDSQHHVPTNYADLHANCTNVFNGGFNEKIHNVAPEMLQNTTHDLSSGFENAEHTFGFD